MCCSLLQSVAVCCSVLQCAAVCCSVLQCDAGGVKAITGDTCDMTHLYMWHDSFIHVTWLIYTCDMTHLYMWHDSFLYVTWLIHRPNMTQLTCVTWLNWHMWRDWMTRGRRRQHPTHRRDMTKLTCVNETWQEEATPSPGCHVQVSKPFCDATRSVLHCVAAWCMCVAGGLQQNAGFCSRENITIYNLCRMSKLRRSWRRIRVDVECASWNVHQSVVECAWCRYTMHMTHPYMWHDVSFRGVKSCLIGTYDMNVHRDAHEGASHRCTIRIISHASSLLHHLSFIPATWLFHTCDSTFPHVTHGFMTHVTHGFMSHVAIHMHNEPCHTNR